MAANDPVLIIDGVSMPATNPATADNIAGANSTSAESFPVWDFDPTTQEYLDFHGYLSQAYGGGGLTLVIAWTSEAATGNAKWDAAFRRLNADSEDLDTTNHTYDYNTVTDAAPTTIGFIVYASITFTDGADMDSLAAGERFILRVSRDSADAADTINSNDCSLHWIHGYETA